ncbi:MAG: hypothetical protein ACTTJY_02185 [Hoylesella shahii]|jgi:hypothetical protein|uniref:hypothetical protein n=1 Tax=Hoylesella shahii TaxID=228603 RepID=UPI0028E62431|nr:hypothetical protein [Hoylesella shahii]
MKKLFISMVMALFSLVGYGQQQQSFKGYLYNEEYQVYLRINFYDNDVLPRGQELFGKLPGYLGSKRDTRLWLITDAKLNKDNEAKLAIINDYGSEDLEAKLEKDNDSIFTLKQGEGSHIKIVVDRKWVKLPKVMQFKMKKN